MRSFVVVGNLATTTPDFSLEDIPGTSGRLDILCRCINSAFVLSHGIRRDVQAYLVLRGGSVAKTIHLRGRELRHLNPDERTTAALLKKALALEADAKWRRSTPGIFVRRGDLADLEVWGEGTTYYLREDGSDHRGVLNAGDGTFVLGDHIGLSEEDEAFLEGLDAKIVSVGPKSLHTDHCIVLINNELDRIEANDETIDRDGTSKDEDGIEEGLTKPEEIDRAGEIE
ncbi:tRNA (pseudouridine(54)-N(1))-methyltransferase TrmY [Candidatus Methanocrinis natronophilus]|uniref:tRNA (pseudouridine(54)-N(1))-methyltransferase n=1 Tax=Candidatus Methanocrinis natronophilus TaxID=3033396 RepID=A0ABT5X4T9_9EURY|nr:tRNA (pseudouridine(54)-N(1))-methyltransferase TrmY [Candidatus Methanocrinis natronophilus]MDF0589711.1 tRNA (pseudouridine(54)-N(1))-methyltransferase TrmY [Candidatus Methanocrinis natronophilus]